MDELTFLRVDHQVRLQCGEIEVVIESPFVLRTGEHEYHLEPEERRGLGPLLGVCIRIPSPPLPSTTRPLSD